jgi:hypothetical protein
LVKVIRDGGSATEGVSPPFFHLIIPRISPFFTRSYPQEIHKIDPQSRA